MSKQAVGNITEFDSNTAVLATSLSFVGVQNKIQIYTNGEIKMFDSLALATSQTSENWV